MGCFTSYCTTERPAPTDVRKARGLKRRGFLTVTVIGFALGIFRNRVFGASIGLSISAAGPPPILHSGFQPYSFPSLIHSRLSRGNEHFCRRHITSRSMGHWLFRIAHAKEYRGRLAAAHEIVPLRGCDAPPSPAEREAADHFLVEAPADQVLVCILELVAVGFMGCV